MIDFAKQEFGDRFWIGAKDKEKEGMWKWPDGSKVKFDGWASGERNGKRAENCMLMLDGQWYDIRCNQNKSSLCEYQNKQRCKIVK